MDSSAAETGKRRADELEDGGDSDQQGPAGKRPRTTAHVMFEQEGISAAAGIEDGSTAAASAAADVKPAAENGKANGHGGGVMNGTGPSDATAAAAVNTQDELLEGEDQQPQPQQQPPAETISSSASAPTAPGGGTATATTAASGLPATSAAATAAASSNASSSATGQATSEPTRWRCHQIAEDYIGMASALLLPTVDLGPFGYDATSGHYPTERITALGLLTSPLRRPTVVERWNPYEICVFEASMALYGKDFHEVARCVGTKNCKEVVEFYYVWKKTEHYKVWKREYTPHLESDSEDEER
mmetsp:Transcript_26638/g.57805  ORF Transcript_26638/g.57805 Transcript_26638/m.57805 type:complete len:302 (-) Transcript_26638:124-1029(-)